MRFIGNKENLLDKIYQVMNENSVKGKSFFDFFAGTTSVGRYFKKLNYQIFSSDLLYFSYVLQQAYIVNNKEVEFKKLLPTLDIKSGLLFSVPLLLIIEYLNHIPTIKDFIYENYTPARTANLEQPRMYFSNENGEKIDAIRQQIEIWKNEKLITAAEYYVLLACLIETVPFYANVAGVFAAFQKKWDPRAIKKLQLRPIEFILNQHTNYAYNSNSTELLEKIKADIFYLDPPYNERQYAPNYHILETIAKYDNPIIKGVTGMRPYDKQKSRFCNADTALQELDKVAKFGQYKYLVLSYNSEGIMPKEKIISTLQKYGKVKFIDFDYTRFKSNSNGDSKHKKFIREELFILEKR
ncbi:MAG: DNA adenine methylase [Candidatus Margulisbacteria bacterium]|jgi:adenine-specific DNA-methyltransferase|nr:DNA adenine methylase [Candidatus Margulisiibacteriota bacterium]